MSTEQSSGLKVLELNAANAEIARLTAQILAMEQAKKEALDNEPQVVGGNAMRASTKERLGIIVEEGNDVNDLSFVPVGVNGRVYQIMRGRVVEVPPEVLGVLDHAILAKSFATADSATGMPNGSVTRNVRRFPYQKLGIAINADGVRINTFEDLNAPKPE